MDPILIAATSGTLYNITEVLHITISELLALRSQYADADFMLVLVGPLTELKIIICKIQDILDSDVVEPHFQLVKDLDVTLACSRMLISKVDGQIFEIRKLDDRLDFASKIKCVFGSNGMNELRKMIDHQTDALGLLSAALQCKTATEQKAAFEKSNLRKSIGAVQQDSESFIVRRSTGSFFSRYAGKLSKFSLSFQFERELLVNNIFDKATLSSSRESLISQRSDSEVDKATKRSRAIDRELEAHARKSRREAKLLLIGSPGSGQDAIAKQMKIMNKGGLTEDEIYLHKTTICSNLLDSAKALVAGMEQFGISPKYEHNYANCITVSEYDLGARINPVLEARIGEAIKSIWEDPCIPELFKYSSELKLIETAPYFLDEANRIAQPDYVPTDLDVVKSRARSNGIMETTFEIEGLTLHMYDLPVRIQRNERKKWFHAFENMTCVIFVVDLASYDQHLSDDEETNRLVDSMALFEETASAKWSPGTSVILFFTNVAEFRTKLWNDPLERYFSDYNDGDNPTKAAKYLLWRFNQLNRASLNVYPHFVNSNDQTSISLAFSSVKETILQNTLRAHAKS